MIYEFEILEKAIGKQRPRYSARTRRMYTPTKTSSFEEKVKYAFLNKYNIATELSTKPFKATITVMFAPAKSLSKKKKEEMIHELHTSRPDIDNITKSILDALNGLAYKDDSQIAILEARKEYAEENKILVKLGEI